MIFESQCNLIRKKSLISSIYIKFTYHILNGTDFANSIFITLYDIDIELDPTDQKLFSFSIYFSNLRFLRKPELSLIKRKRKGEY